MPPLERRTARREHGGTHQRTATSSVGSSARRISLLAQKLGQRLGLLPQPASQIRSARSSVFASVTTHRSPARPCQRLRSDPSVLAGVPSLIRSPRRLQDGGGSSSREQTLSREMGTGWRPGCHSTEHGRSSGAPSAGPNTGPLRPLAIAFAALDRAHVATWRIGMCAAARRRCAALESAAERCDRADRPPGGRAHRT